MNPLDFHELLLWSTIIAIVILAVITGRWINRFLTYRAHRRALDELRRRAIESHPGGEAAGTHLSALPCEARSPKA